ncbi:MAG: Lpp/OprI family alanine-zipper lipoprotein [Gammaproteobacteria bacterium]
MQHTLKLAARGAAIALAVGLGAGCATTGELEEVKGIANNALNEARAARDTANNAQGAVNDAAAAAAEAQRTADAAQACCNETNDKLDRAWHKGMQK